MRTTPRTLRADHGFTLVELLVVVMILGILSAIGIPTFLAQREAGWQAQLITDTRSAVVEVEAEFARLRGRYPADQAAFNALGITVSDPGISWTYNVNTGRSEYCIAAEHTRLDVDREVAYASSGGGMQDTNACPAFISP